MRQLIIAPNYLWEHRLYRFKFSNKSHVLMKYFWYLVFALNLL